MAHSWFTCLLNSVLTLKSYDALFKKSMVVMSSAKFPRNRIWHRNSEAVPQRRGSCLSVALAVYTLRSWGMGASTPRGTWAGHQQHASQAIFTTWTHFVMKFLGMWSDCEVTTLLSFYRGEQWNSERWNHLDKARESISRAGTLIQIFKLQLPFI